MRSIDVGESVEKKLLAVVLFGLVSQGVAAAAPAWCKDAKFDETDDLADLKATEGDRINYAIRTVVKASCKPGASIKGQAAAVEARRKQLSADMGMNDADWADAVAFVNNNESAPEIKVSTKDLGTMTPIDQYQVIWDGVDTPGGNHFDDYNYLTDMFEPSLSEVGKFAYIRKCIQVKSVSSVGGDAVQYAMCQGDIDAFDVTKFGAQLRADTAHDAAQRMQVRAMYYALKAEELPEHKKHLAKIFKEDAAYKKLFDAAKAGRDEWKTTFGADTAGLDLVRKMDSGTFYPSRKMLEGCQDTTGKALDAAIAKSAPVKTFKNLGDTRKDPYEGVAKVIGPALAAQPAIYWAAMPYILCQPKTMKADFFAYYIQESPGFRGPRAAAYTKIMNTSVVLDDPNAKVQYPAFYRPYNRSGGTMGSAGAVIKSVKAKGDILIAEGENLPVKIDVCTKSHSTGRIERINWSTGDLYYGSVCDKSETKTINDQWQPFEVNKKYASIVKKGVRISIIYGGPPDGGKDEGSDVIATWPNKTATVPDTIFGVPVK